MLKVDNTNIKDIWALDLEVWGRCVSLEAHQNGTAYKMQNIEKDSALKPDWEYEVKSFFVFEETSGSHRELKIRHINTKQISSIEDIKSLTGSVGTLKSCEALAKSRVRELLSTENNLYFNKDNKVYLCMQYQLGINSSVEHIEYELADLLCEDTDYVDEGTILRLRLGLSSRDPDGTYYRDYHSTLYAMDKDWVLVDITTGNVIIVNDEYIEEFLINYA